MGDAGYGLCLPRATAAGIRCAAKSCASARAARFAVRCHPLAHVTTMSPGVLSILYDVRLTLFLPSCTPRQDALAAFSEAAKIFIHYLTSTASDMCQETKRSTITADDVIKAVHELDFGDLVPPLEGALEVFRAQMKERNEKKLAATKATKKRKAEEATADQGKGEGEGATVEADGAGGVEVAAAGAEGGAATDAEGCGNPDPRGRKGRVGDVSPALVVRSPWKLRSW